MTVIVFASMKFLTIWHIRRRDRGKGLGQVVLSGDPHLQERWHFHRSPYSCRVSLIKSIGDFELLFCVISRTFLSLWRYSRCGDRTSEEVNRGLHEMMVNISSCWLWNEDEFTLSAISIISDFRLPSRDGFADVSRTLVLWFLEFLWKE